MQRELVTTDRRILSFAIDLRGSVHQYDVHGELKVSWPGSRSSRVANSRVMRAHGWTILRQADAPFPKIKGTYRKSYNHQVWRVLKSQEYSENHDRMGRWEQG